jgi:hypothetical protein
MSTAQLSACTTAFQQSAAASGASPSGGNGSAGTSRGDVGRVPVVVVGVEIAIVAMGATATRRVKERNVSLAAIAMFPQLQLHFGLVLLDGAMACGDVGFMEML